MSNNFYNHGSYPTPNAPGSSAALRAELQLITQGFDKLPTLTGNANKLVVVNSAGTGLEAATAIGSLAITGSTINDTPIGNVTPSTGAFTTLSASGAASLGTSVTIGGGTINNTPIGGTTPSSGAFTTVSASSGFTGNLAGNVSGNVSGNLTGNVTSSGTSTFANVTVTSSLGMSGQRIANVGTPTATADATTKAYVDALGVQLEAIYDQFDDRYLGPKSSDPSVDNDGNTLLVGALYWNTVSNVMKVWTGTAWIVINTANNPVDQTDVGTAPNEIPLNQYLGPLAYLQRPYRKVQRQLATSGQTAFTITGGYAAGFIDVFQNGLKLYSTDFTETDSSTVTLTVGATLNDEMEFIVWWAGA